jgi:hypothetical protein
MGEIEKVNLLNIINMSLAHVDRRTTWSEHELGALWQGFSKPATGEGMDKSTFVHTQIQIIIIHFLPFPFSPIPNG